MLPYAIQLMNYFADIVTLKTISNPDTDRDEFDPIQYLQSSDRLKAFSKFHVGESSGKPLLVLFEEVIKLSTKSNCHDERDKIYGILGLIDRVISRYIEPNYALLVYGGRGYERA
jgi:hypothetical protein